MHAAMDPSVVHGVHSLDAFLEHFPVPGEVWTHLFAMTNYYSALLLDHPPPGEGEPPWTGRSRSNRSGTAHRERLAAVVHAPA